MSKQLFALTAIALFLLAGCAEGGALPALKKSGTIRVAFPTTPDTGDVPSLMAHELLRAQGYTVESTFFASPDVQVAAVAHGDADISNGSTRTHWAAVQKGADLLTLMEQAADVWALVVRPGIASCADLDGKKVGVNSAGSITNALLQAYVHENCPAAQPEALYVSGSENRSAALQAGELDGTLLELADVLELEKSAPGKFPILINYATALPKLKTNAVYATRDFAQKHPDMVRDYIRALLTVHRTIREDPTTLYTALANYAKMDPAKAKEVGDLYLKNNIWNPNGSLSVDDVSYSVDFFVQSKSLPAGLDPAKITDSSFLDAVLQEIGRK